MGKHEDYVEKFEDETGWRPGQVALFSGALLYTQYGFIKRLIMKKIASDKGSPDMTLHAITSTQNGAA